MKTTSSNNLSRLRRSAFRTPRSALLLEPLEPRFALSGFGPEDGAYIVESWEGAFDDVAVRASDQAIVTAGYAGSGSPELQSMAVARYDAAGNPDNTFSGDGLATFGPASARARGIELQGDGRMVVGGSAGVYSNADTTVARLNADGSPDTAFGTGGWTTTNIGPGDGAMNIGLKSNGNLVVAGQTGDFGMIASYTTAGALHSGKNGFGTISKGKSLGYNVAKELYTLSEQSFTMFNSLAVQPDDKSVIVGFRMSLETYQRTLIVARYTASGLLDTTFSGDGWATLPVGGEAHAVALQPDGRIVVAGWGAAPGVLVSRFNTNGTLDTTFGGGLGYVRFGISEARYAFGYGVALQPDGRIVVAGDWDPAATSISDEEVFVARLNSDGSSDTSFSNTGYKLGISPPAGFSFQANDVTLQSDGSILVAGHQRNIGGTAVYHPLLMRFSGATNAPLVAASVTESPSATSETSATDAALLFWLTEELTTTKRRN